MRPLAITGVGQVSPLGLGLEALREAFADPEAAAKRAFTGEPEVLTREKFPEAHSAEVWGFDPNAHLGDKGHRNFDRLTKYLIVAAKLALEDAGVKKDGEFVGALAPEQVGICSSTAYGSLDSITELNLVAELEDPRYINPARFPNTVINAAAGYVSIWEISGRRTRPSSTATAAPSTRSSAARRTSPTGARTRSSWAAAT